MVLYKIQITIKPPIFADQGSIPSLLHLPSIMLANAKGYLKNIYLQSTKVLDSFISSNTYLVSI